MIEATRTRLVAIFLVLLATLHGPIAGASNKYRGHATDDAFAALLLMPSAMPDEPWEIPKPDDYAVANEQELIIYLALKRKTGAEIDAYRHFGTLLHHAIRAGLSETALWLLEQGADPRLKLRPDQYGEGQRDALDLARQFGLKEVAKRLIEQHGMSEPVAPVAAPAKPAVAEAMATASSRVRAGEWSAQLLQAAVDQLRHETHAAWAQADTDMARQQWWSLLQGLSNERRREFVRNPEAIEALVVLAAPEAQAIEQLLKWLPRAERGALAGPIIDGLIRSSSTPPGSAKQPAELAFDSWLRVWSLLPVPIDYGESKTSRGPGMLALIRALTPEQLAALFASGLSALPAEEFLGCYFSEVSAAELQAAWPVLYASYPELKERVASRVLDHYRMGVYCWSWDESLTLAKLRWLEQAQLLSPVRGLLDERLEYVDKELLQAINHLRAPALDDAVPRLMPRERNCELDVSAALKTRLRQDPTIGDPPVYIETLLPIEVPGEKRCGFLLSGSWRVEQYGSGRFDSFYGYTDEPTPSCPDPTDATEVWWEAGDGTIQRIPSELQSGDYLGWLQPVSDQKSGEVLWFSWGAVAGRCAAKSELPFLVRFERIEGNWRLNRFAPKPSNEQVMLEQCEFRQHNFECKGLRNDYGPDHPGADEMLPMPIELFMRMQPGERDVTEAKARIDRLKQQHESGLQAYVQLVMELDLQRLRKFDLGPDKAFWTREALLSVSRSSLPLDAKRKRIAWLFHDHPQLDAAIDESVIDELRGWLPREDWWPVLKLIAADPGRWRTPLVGADDIEQDPFNPVNCALQHAQGRLCGETGGDR